jgi:hypothetical protein
MGEIQGGLVVRGQIECDSLRIPRRGIIYADRYPITPVDPLLGIVMHLRTRVTLAEMNAGKTLLGAAAGVAYRVNDVKVIAIGGAAAATADATGVALYGTKAGTATAIYTALLAALTENAVCQVNTTDTSVPNAGALYTANDQNTALTCKSVSAGAFDLITTTHFDILLSYCVEVQ